VNPISVVVITYNEEKSIRDCLESLAALDYPRGSYEVIVVDASDDRTSDIVASFDGVRLIRAAKGFSSQKNAGLEAARHDLIAFTDADCRVPPDWLRVIDRSFAGTSSAALGGNAFPPPGSSRFGLWSACTGHPGGGAIGFDANVTPGPGAAEFAAGCNSAYRRPALAAVGGFHPDFQDGGEDVDLARRLRGRGFRIDYVPDLTVYHLPRLNLRAFFRWNVGVGATKYSLRRPGWAGIVFNPFFPPWPAAMFAAMFFLPAFPWGAAGVLVLAGAGYLAALRLRVKPYRLLWARRRAIGISVSAALFIVPALIALRQTGIAWGEWKKRRKVRPAAHSR
jgi:GT2 family glycosyltransferase